MASPLSDVVAGPATTWEGTGATVAEIAGRLREMRAQAAAGRPHGRSTLLNLVVWAPSADDAAAASELLDILVGPSRIIVLSPDAEATGIGARLEVHTRQSPIAQATICEELVRLSLAADTADHAASVVTPLVRGDLPTYVWWPAPPEPRLPAYRELAGAADRLVTEAERGRNGADALALLVGEIERGDTAITDLAWGALTPWRQLVSQMLRPAQVEALREGPTEAVLTHGGPYPTLGTLLLAGWLRDVLGGSLHVSFRPEPGAPSALAGIDLKGPTGRRLQARRVGKDSSCTVKVDVPGDESRGRTLPLRVQSRMELIAGELEIRGPDAGFERAVARAALLSEG